jgi:predicted Zn-dependent protease
VRKWPLFIFVGVGVGLLAWYERDKFFVNSSKLLSVEQLKAEVKKQQAQAVASGKLATGYFHAVDVTGRQQVLFTTEAQENDMGQQSYASVLASGKLCGDQSITEIVNRVGWNLATIMPPNDYNWQFNTLEDKTVNAFCLPGGEVAVYTGILPYCQNEASLAAVLGHEMGHAIARHGGERMAETGVMQGAQTAMLDMLKKLGFTSAQQSAALASFGFNQQMGITWPYTRMQETEADEMGLVYMAKAGYNPSQAIDFWDRMSGTGTAVVTDHPSTADRLADLKSKLDNAMALYANSGQFGAGEDLPS